MYMQLSCSTLRTNAYADFLCLTIVFPAAVHLLVPPHIQMSSLPSHSLAADARRLADCIAGLPRHLPQQSLRIDIQAAAAAAVGRPHGIHICCGCRPCRGARS